jgi:hypothetical protein
MAKEIELVRIDFDKIIHQTDESYLLEICEEEFWLPKSQIKEMKEDEKFVILPEWLAMNNGLI